MVVIPGDDRVQSTQFRLQQAIYPGILRETRISLLSIYSTNMRNIKNVLFFHKSSAKRHRQTLSFVCC